MNNVPLVLVTGLLSNKEVFQYQIKKLSHLVYIFVIELTDTDSPAVMVEKILDIAPESFALAGHSIGGWAALRLMKAASEKVVKLCLLNTSARGIDPEETIARQTVLTRVENGEFKKIATEIANKFTFNEAVKENVLKMFLQVGEHALVNQTRAMLIREDLRDILPGIHCPTLVIHASEDKRFSLDVHEEIAHNIPNAKLAIIDDCGHMSPMESPYAIASLIRYWLSYF
ncbi:MAG: hypothetical protein A3E87_00035 [Gammaproteobacteria bacterium RIFCSPHIGHO2_12_FULL_35_23]|nr:MAG: hypothetical protein A3E87_00035 [Gammaproteobacteria bacterium RIFCSPHIGHO2_12_FULL_35_23]HLB42821.1 alpha/beta hydrolase [Gammaproteobacteria bacterium]